MDNIHCEIATYLYAVYFEDPQYRITLQGFYTEEKYEQEKERIQDVARRKGLKAVTFVYRKFDMLEELN